MTNEDYKLEELENAAVKKSNNAKRMAAIAAGLVGSAAVSGGATYAATHNASDNVVEEPLEDLTTEELDDIAGAGARQVEKPEMRTDPTEENHHNNTNPVVEPVSPKSETEVNFDKTTHVYDENGNLVLTTEEGTVDGHQFKLIDLDNDQRADYVALDVDGNGVYTDDEIVELTGNDQIAMGNQTRTTDNIYVASNDPDEKVEIYDIDDEKNDVAYNHENFDDEKSGQIYDPTSDSDSESYAYSDYKEESDYGYGDMAENTSNDVIDDLGNDSFDLI